MSGTHADENGEVEQICASYNRWNGDQVKLQYVDYPGGHWLVILYSKEVLGGYVENGTGYSVSRQRYCTVKQIFIFSILQTPRRRCKT